MEASVLECTAMSLNSPTQTDLGFRPWAVDVVANISPSGTC
jgi:hypothetical protein